MLLKLMHEGGDFELIEVSSCAFQRIGDTAHAVFKHTVDSAEQVVALRGSAYIMNQAGDTIESYHVRQAGRKL